MPNNDANKTSQCKNELANIKHAISLLDYCSKTSKNEKSTFLCDRNHLGLASKKIADSIKLLNTKEEFKPKLHDEVTSLLKKINEVKFIQEMDKDEIEHYHGIQSSDMFKKVWKEYYGPLNVVEDQRPLLAIFESDWKSTDKPIENGDVIGGLGRQAYEWANVSDKEHIRFLDESQPFSFLKNSSPKELCLADINPSSAEISTPSAGVSIKETNAVSTSGSMFSDTTEPNLAPPLNKGQIQTNGYLISLGLGAIGGVLDEVSEIMLNILERKNCSKKTIRCVATVLAFANSFAITTLPFIYNIMQVLDNDDDAVNHSKKLMDLTLTFFISALVSNCVFQGLKQGLNRCSKTVSNKTIKFLLSVLPFLGYLWMVANGENTLEGFAIAGSSLIGVAAGKFTAKGIGTGVGKLASCTFFSAKNDSINNLENSVTEANPLIEQPNALVSVNVENEINSHSPRVGSSSSLIFSQQLSNPASNNLENENRNTDNAILVESIEASEALCSVSEPIAPESSLAELKKDTQDERAALNVSTSSSMRI